MAQRLRFDRILFADVAGLCLLGLTMVYSASAMIATNRYDKSPYHFVLNQGSALLVGILAAIVVMSFDYRKLRHPLILYGSLGLTVASLITVLFLPSINNTHRWLVLGPISFQPSELGKIPLILFLAHWLDRQRDQLENLTGTLLPAAAVSGGLTLMVLIEPDFGTAMLYILVTATLFFLAGLPLRYFVTVACTVVPVLVTFVSRSEYRMKRILSFLDPESDPLGSGFQATQSLIAHGSGGSVGAGLGNSHQKLFFLPEPHTDFIFSIVGEELGLIGVVALLGLFLVFFWRAVQAARHAPDRFGYYLALGIGSMVVLQALIHTSVTLALLPTKGLPLPFISYGKSFLLTCLLGSGILLNISQHGE